MTDSMKKMLVIGAVVLAVVLCIVSISHTVMSNQPHDAGRLGGGVADPAHPGGKGKMGGE